MVLQVFSVPSYRTPTSFYKFFDPKLYDPTRFYILFRSQAIGPHVFNELFGPELKDPTCFTSCSVPSCKTPRVFSSFSVLGYRTPGVLTTCSVTSYRTSRSFTSCSVQSYKSQVCLRVVRPQAIGPHVFFMSCSAPSYWTPRVFAWFFNSKLYDPIHFYVLFCLDHISRGLPEGDPRIPKLSRKRLPGSHSESCFGPGGGGPQEETETVMKKAPRESF